MARIEERVFAYGLEEFLVPADLQVEISKHFERTFSDDDFLKMSEALAVAESVWRTRRTAPDKKLVTEHLKGVQDAADRLLRLLFPTSGVPIRPAITEDRKRIAAEFAIRRLHARVTRPTEVKGGVSGGDDQQEAGRPRVIEAMLLPLSILRTSATVEIESVSTLAEMSSGGDSDHIDRLLKCLLPILRRNGLSDSYTTRVIESDDRNAAAVDLAMLLVPLWPDDIPTPTESAVMNRLVKIRNKINQRAAG